LFALIALKAGFVDSGRTAFYLIGFATTTGLYLWLFNLLPVMGSTAMVKKLNAKLAGDGIDTNKMEGVFVGFSPHSAVRFYESNDDWDLGYLIIGGNNVLYYIGEQTRFALGADDILEIKTASTSLNWWKSERVFVKWMDRTSNTVKTFNLHSCDATSLTDASRKTHRLAERLRDFKSSSADTADVPAFLDCLEPPRIGEVTSRALSEIVAPGKVIYLISICLFCATVVGLGLQLPFSPARGGGGLYVIAVTLIVTLLEVLPMLQNGRRQSQERARQQQPLASLEAIE
jgi:hypothetical protein